MIAYNHKVVFYANGTVHVRKYKNPIKILELTEEEKADKRDKKIESMTERVNMLHDLKDTFPFDENVIDDLKLFDDVLTDDEILRRKQKSQYVSWHYTVSKINEYARSGSWEWFLTFTFSDKELRYDFSECSKKIRKWLSNMRLRYAPDLQYLIVPEQHADGAFHFHGLFARCGSIKFEKAINPHSNQVIKQNNKEVYNLTNFRFGFTTATKVEDTKKVTNYILKYITKDMCNNTFSKRRYFVSNNIPKPVVDLHMINDVDSQSAFLDLHEKYDMTYYKKSVVDDVAYNNEVEYFDFSLKEKEV